MSRFSESKQQGSGFVRHACAAEDFAAIEAVVFDKPWAEADFVAGPERRQASLWLEDRCVSFIYGHVVAGEAEVWRIATLPECRGKGYAKRVLAAFLESCREAGAESVFLEVSSDNIDALGFYLRAGFAVTGRRADYYGPGEDALLLGLSLEKNAPAD